MKIVAKPVDALVIFHQGEHPLPYKFKYAAKDGAVKYVQVDKVLETEERQFGSMPVIIYRCQSRVGEQDVRYELKYVLRDARWELYKA